MSAADNDLNPVKASAEWTSGTAKVQVYDHRTAMGDAAASAIANQIRKVAEANGCVRMVFAAAPSQADVLNSLTQSPNIPWEKVTAFHMDDYLGLPSDAPQRFANWLDNHLFSRVSLGAVHRIGSVGDPEAICRSYTALLNEAPIDIVCLGIGVNGHIAFNDPPVAEFNDPLFVKVVVLDQICRQQQVDDKCFTSIDKVPSKVITLTIPRLMAANALFCVVPGAHKRAAVKAALEGPVVSDCPASILQTHPNCTVFLDQEANPSA